jgi:hypothetical protein
MTRHYQVFHCLRCCNFHYPRRVVPCTEFDQVIIDSSSSEQHHCSIGDKVLSLLASTTVHAFDENATTKVLIQNDRLVTL